MNQIKKLNKLAYPILLNYLLSVIFEVLDKAIIGHYSAKSFGAVGIAAGIIYELTGAVGILSLAFNITAAEEIGKQNEQKFISAFIASKKMALYIGLGFSFLSLIGGRFFFGKVYGIYGNNLNELLSYFYPASLTMVLNLLLFQYSAYFRNRLNTKITFYSTTISTLVNLFFDYSLVYGKFKMPKMGVSGAAWGSVIGLVCGLLLYQIIYFISKKNLPISDKTQIKTSALKILKLYPSLFGKEFLENTVFTLVLSGIIAKLGTEAMAIHGLLESFGQIITLPVYAYATASQTLSVISYSKNEKSGAYSYLKYAVLMASVWLVVLSCVLLIFPEFFMKMIISDDVIISSAVNILGIYLIIPIIKAPCQILSDFLQGAGQEKYVFNITVIISFIFCAVLIFAAKFAALSGIYCAITVKILIYSLLYHKKVNKLGRI